MQALAEVFNAGSTIDDALNQAARETVATRRIPLHCKDCGILLVEFEQKTDNVMIPHVVENLFGVQVPDAGLHINGVAIGVCPKCGGKTEFPAKYLSRFWGRN